MPGRKIPGSDRLYAPPAGYIDRPFAWVYDGTNPNGLNIPLVNGNTYRNQYVYIQSGYGDFFLRRIVGLDTILNNSQTGQFQIRRSSGAYLQNLPTCVGIGGPGTLAQNSGQMAVVPEVPYKETSQIVFDLYNILLNTAGNGIAAQIAFQGVRRQKGTEPNPYKYNPKTYTYITNANVGASTGTPLNPVVSQVIQPINNYDFDLYQIFVTYNDILVLLGESESHVLFEPTLPLTAPAQTITIKITRPVTANQPLTISTVGAAITIQLATDAFAQPLTTGAQLAALINNDIHASVFITAIVLEDPTGFAPDTGGVVTPIIGAPLSANFSQANLMLFDHNGVQVYSQPMLDLFVNASSYYVNGAIVPPLFYQKDSRLRMDVTTFNGPFFITLEYVGRQRIPC